MRSLFLSVIIALCVVTVNAQNAASVFINMPRDIAIMLTDDNRKEMVGLFMNKKPAKILNLSESESELTHLTDSYLKLQLTVQNTLEIKLLPYGNRTVICVVQTACAPVCDSRAALYSSEWMPLTEIAPLPDLQPCQFLNKKDEGSEARKNALTALDMRFYRYELSAKNNCLLVYYTTPELLGLEDRKLLKPYLLTRPLTLRWSAEGFR